MEKFTNKLNEGTIFNSPLTKTEFESYKKFINRTLYEMYPDRAVDISESKIPIIVYKAFDYEKQVMPGREFSIIGKVNTNINLLNNLWSYFGVKDYRHLENLISKFKKDFFNPEGNFFKSKSRFSVWDEIRSSEIIGENNEEFACASISLTWPDSNPIREVTSSYKDMILGIDITFKIDGQEKTCQVKPLTTDNFKERGVVVIETNGVIKDYKTDYIAFVNKARTYRDKMLLFKNEGGIFDPNNKKITLPFKNLVRIQIPKDINVNNKS